jgi:hypothetical protein
MTPAQLERATAAGNVLEELKQEIYFQWVDMPPGPDADSVGDDIDRLDRALEELDVVLLHEDEELAA